MKQKLTYINFSDNYQNIGNYITCILLSAIIYFALNMPIVHAAEYYMGTGIVQGDLVYEHEDPDSPYNPNKFAVPDNVIAGGSGPKPIADNDLGVSLDGLIVNLGYHLKDVRSGLSLELGYYTLSGSYYNPTPAEGSSFFANVDYQNQYAVARYHIPFARYFSVYVGSGFSNSIYSQSYSNVTYHYGKLKPFRNFGLRLRLKTVFVFLDYSTILVEDKYQEAGTVLYTGPNNTGDRAPSATPFLDTTAIKIDTFTFGTAIYFGSGAR
ncbi:MAG: hypothetical protein K0U39_05335 [Alphaproteobacteria bacterium]|nr:hypothetical protein [Alphaproteobacteria bacterium]